MTMFRDIRWAACLAVLSGLAINTAPLAAAPDFDEKGTLHLHGSRTPAMLPPLIARDRVNEGTDTNRPIVAPEERDEFSFVILADRTTGPREGVNVLRRAVEMTNDLDPAFVMTVGDMINGYNQAPEWMAEMREYHDVMGSLSKPWYPVAGNHDVYERPATEEGHIALYKQHFGPLYYSFDYKWAHIICLFSDESLSFSNPAVTQNMSSEQMQWLRDDLAATDAEQVYVFMHHPRWLYRGCNWPDVHDILVEDGRVAGVIAGHIHTYRDDGNHDGIHYYAMAVTGGSQGSFNASVNMHHLNLVRVTRDGFSMTVHPIDSFYSGAMARGEEVDEMNRLNSGGWVRVRGPVRASLSDRSDSGFTVEVWNPTSQPLTFDLELDLPAGATGSLDETRVELQPGKARSIPARVSLPALDVNAMPRVSVRGSTVFLFDSGLRQPLEQRADSRLYLDDVGELAAANPTSNGVLVLDGESAARVDLSDSLAGMRAFTLECWVRGDQPDGRVGLVTRTENSAFGIFWSETNSTIPAGYAHLPGGYAEARASAAWDYTAWTHVALCYDGSHVRLFVNGELSSEVPAIGPITPNRLPLFIGADTDGRGRPMSYFTGAIDEVRLSSACRYTAAFTPQRTLSSDAQTLVMLHFDDTAGRLAADESSFGHHAWLIGNAKVVREGR